MEQQAKLTKEQALEVLTKATANFQGSRQEHALIQLSLAKVNELVERSVQKEDEPPKE